jgi:Protein of unknown function (DUF2971)
MEADDAAWQRQFGRPRPDPDKVARLLPDLEEGVRKNVEKLGMFCLSAKSDDILMWSHYSSSHQGICLGFRTTGNSILADAQPVDYADVYPVVDYLGMTSEQRVSKMILTKSKRWEYEQEWRVFRAWAEPGIEVYPAGLLAQIILGCQIRPRDQEEIVEAASRLAQPPDIYEAKRSASQFQLELARLNNGAV